MNFALTQNKLLPALLQGGGMEDVMRKKLLIFAAFLIVISASGCNTLPQGQNTPSDNPQNSSESSSQPEENKKTKISVTPSPIDVNGYEALSKCMYDVINDGNEDIITLYTSAERDMTGEMMWDDTQEWVLQVETDKGVYDLYDERIHGRAYLNVSDYYNDGDEQKVISLYIAGKSFNEIREYRFDDGKFIEETAYSTDNNANEGIGTLYSSIPDYE